MPGKWDPDYCENHSHYEDCYRTKRMWEYVVQYLKKKKNINVPQAYIECYQNINFSEDSMYNYSLKHKIGAFLTKELGLTLDDCSEKLREEIKQYSKDSQEQYIGAEYITKIMDAYKEKGLWKLDYTVVKAPKKEETKETVPNIEQFHPYDYPDGKHFR